MVVETVTLKLPENLYQRLVSHADANSRPLEDVILHALTVGSPPVWEDVPAEYQTTLAEMARYDELLEKNKQDKMSEAERSELNRLRSEADQFMLRKAHSAALLRWRGHPVPNP